jgi:hypothetical protein
MNIKVLNFILIFFVFLLIILNSTAFAQSIWKENSFEDFIDGQFLDAGSNLYVSASGRMQIINRWDFNNDGNLDIFLPAGHGHTEKENTYIYLNNGKDIDGRSRIELPGGGSRDGLVADFNKDGFNDLAIANSADSHDKRVFAWIYLGGKKGFSVDNRVELPAYQGRSITAGHFNGDGWLDLAIACQWQAGTVAKPEGPQMSFIYWNSQDGFDPENRLALSFDEQGAVTFAAKDLDKDEKDDLVALAAGKTFILFSSRNAFQNPENRDQLPISGTALSIGNVNQDDFQDLAICTKGKVVVIFGNKNGYVIDNSVSFDVPTPNDVVLSDINNDGFDDVVIANHASKEGATWVNSFIFFSDGNDFSKRDVLELPTLGATAVSAGDLNGDGYPEVIFSNQRITNQLNIGSYVYWNDGGRLYFGNHTQLATLGSVENTIGDVNNDDLPDVIFLNEEGYFRDGPTTSYLYWGDGTRNFSEQRRTSFQTHHIFGYGNADLDDDGHVDLILSQERFVSRIPHEQGGLITHWGESGRFSAPTYLPMTTAYGGVRIADINRDGYLDMVVGGACLDLENPAQHGIPIFWGSPNGFQHHNRTVIHHDVEKMRAPLLMDLNRDGWLDIAGQVVNGKIKIWWGKQTGFVDDNFTEIDLGREDHLMYIKAADFNKDGWLDLLLPKRQPYEAKNTSFIYYGSPDGFSNNNRIEIQSHVPYDNSIADFDHDGWLDIFLTSYGTDATGNRPSLIHWGSPNGFSDRPITELTTYGSSGSEVMDFDNDGWLDIFVANHRQAGSNDEPIPHRHITPSMLFWGSPAGFSNENRWEVMATGPSGLNNRDLGNSYDRGFYEDYISSAYKIPDGEKPVSISWQAEIPHGTSVKFQVRVSVEKSALESAGWIGAKGKDSWFVQSGSKIKGLQGNWIQYRARLMTPNGGATPYLTDVMIKFE